MNEYFPRIIDQDIRQKLSVMGAVVIEGPKWCGKTTTAEQFAKSRLYLADPEKINEYRIIGDVSPKSMLEGNKPRLIDEWQVAPKLWDAIRSDVDHSADFGRYLLTGSATPQGKEDVFHSGVGRFAWVKMRPMSLFESGDSNGKVSLMDLFSAKKDLVGSCELSSLKALAFLTCRGGWPSIKRISDKTDSLQIAFEYVNGIVKSEFGQKENNDKKNNRLRRVLRSLARHQGSQVSQETIMADVGENITSPKTIKSDLDELARLFVTEDSIAWNPNLRSKVAIRTSNTRYFIDPSIGTAALGLGPDDLMEDLNTFGFLIETLCIRDLRIYAEANKGELYHYRDKSGLECDAVIHLRSGKYGLAEIKIGGEQLINDAAKNLAELRDNIDTTKMQAPSFCAVITGVGTYAYRREDGIYVVPIGCLGP